MGTKLSLTVEQVQQLGLLMGQFNVILTGIVLMELCSAEPKERCSVLWKAVASGAGSC